MSQLIQLKRRIKSIKTTEKVTHAMRLIAMSLYTKLEKERVPIKYYKQNVENTFKYLSAQHPSWQKKIFSHQDLLDSRPLFIIISATKGFCGGLNNNLFKYLEMVLFVEEHQQPKFITIGKKATAYVKNNNLGEIIESIHDLNSNNYIDISNKLTKIITEKGDAFSSVTMYSSTFKNFFAQRPSKNIVLPIKFEESNENDQESPLNTEDGIEPIWEQNPSCVLNYMANKYINSYMMNILFQALVSEYAARFVAMDGATTNAENYLETLTRQFNKLRQALITREVSELSASL